MRNLRIWTCRGLLALSPVGLDGVCAVWSEGWSWETVRLAAYVIGVVVAITATLALVGWGAIR